MAGARAGAAGVVAAAGADARHTQSPSNREATDLTDVANKEIVLEAQDLGKEVSSPEGPLAIVREVSFQVQSGESVAIVGASGAGKSTLLALLAGLDLPTSGRVLLAGQDLNALDEDGRARLRAERVGFVFQSFHLVPALTALENVMLPLELAGRRDARAGAREALERVGLGSRVGHYPRQLSGGQEQRVAIARALVSDPMLVLADEPTGDLDRKSADDVLALLRLLNEKYGKTILMVTHDHAAAQQARTIVHLDKGGRLGRIEVVR